ncbi:MAG: UDP-N-acetylmuramate--L-alanine ligase [Lachnospiraceae bacterium]
MYQIDINKPVHIHFIGIGGISMSGLAALLASKGFTVSGSDRGASPITKTLESHGIKVCIGQSASNISDDIDVVVYTAAIHPDNPEYAACVEKGLPLMDRATLLGQICKFYNTSIGVAGTHGKTTTTSMLSMILLNANSDPTISVGGILPAIGGNLRIGNGDSFLFEACEYTNSFLKFYPTDEIILNIEADHLDFFKDLNEIRQSFRKYALLLPETGHLVINGEINNYKEITEGVKCKISTYGLLAEGQDYHSCDYNYTAANISFDEFGKATYDLVENGSIIKTITLGVPGIHNVSNSLAAAALALNLGISADAIAGGLFGFTGTERRFQKKGEICGITIIDDYAHHPTEISATLSTAKKYNAKNVWCVFQPHTYSRTKALRQEFVNALSGADKVVLAKIYAAREIDTGEISSADLCEDLKKAGVEAYYFPTFDEIENFLLKTLTTDDLLITMGAGDIVKVGEHLLGN